MGAPVNYTCPDIDRIIQGINSVINLANEWDAPYNEVYYSLVNLPYELERLRSANASLRAWGEDLEEGFDSSETEIGKLKDEYSALTKEKERLEKILIENGIEY